MTLLAWTVVTCLSVQVGQSQALSGTRASSAPPPSSPIAASNCAFGWVPTFNVGTGLSDQSNCMAVFDDGGGPDLYVGGWFDTVGAAPSPGLARWTSHGFEPIGAPIFVDDLVAFDSGSSRALYAGGYCGGPGPPYSALWRWDGATWEAVGGGLTSSLPFPSNCAFTRSLAVHDDGAGPKLWVTGFFDRAGSVSVPGLAAWDGAAWSAHSPPPSPLAPLELVSHDDGSGPQLYCYGYYTGGPPNVWRLGPSGWTNAGAGTLGVLDLAEVDLGTGKQLFARVELSPGVLSLARWNGSSWIIIPSPLGAPYAIGQYDIGGVRKLIGRVNAGCVTWDGSNWALLPGGVPEHYLQDPEVLAHRSFDDGSGPKLFMVGEFTSIDGSPRGNFAHFDGASWGGPVHPVGVDAVVNALAAFDDGSGTALYAGGYFSKIHDAPFARVARWDGADWSPLGEGTPNGQVRSLAASSVGGPSALYVGGEFSSAGGVLSRGLARWSNGQWSQVGGHIMLGTGTGNVHCFAEYDAGAGTELYIGGRFTTAAGVPCSNVAKWNGSTWAPLGAGLNGRVYAITVFDDGAGPRLYAAGNFPQAPGSSAECIARWDGSSWSGMNTAPVSLGSNVGSIRALAGYDDGSGPALYVGGAFGAFQGQPSSPLVRWRNGSWESFAQFSGARVEALHVFDDGAGPALYATGIGALPQNSLLARWNGSWTQVAGLGTLPNSFGGYALTTYDDGSGPALFLGGDFLGDVGGDRRLAKYGCVGQLPPMTFCSPSAASTHGCVPRIAVSGHPDTQHLATCVLTLTELPGATTAIVFYGVSGRQQRSWCLGGASELCVRAPLQALAPTSSGGAVGACGGALVEDWNVFQLANPAALGNPWSAGAAVDIQAWFRDAPACSGSLLTEGVRVFYQP